MRRRIEVSWQHIYSGMRGCDTACMVALALRDAGFVNPAVLVGLGYEEEGISIDGLKPVDFPDSLSERICAFEFGKTVQPFHFDVWLIDGDIVQIGDAFDMDTHTDDCADLIGAIENLLEGVRHG